MLQNIGLLKSTKHVFYHQQYLRKSLAASIPIGQDILSFLLLFISTVFSTVFSTALHFLQGTALSEVCWRVKNYFLTVGNLASGLLGHLAVTMVLTDTYFQ